MKYLKLFEKFKDWSARRSMKNLMSKLIVNGDMNGKPFEINIFYTPIQGKIMGVESSNINVDELTIPFDEGDNISVAKNWCGSNGYKVQDIKKHSHKNI